MTFYAKLYTIYICECYFVIYISNLLSAADPTGFAAAGRSRRAPANSTGCAGPQRSAKTLERTRAYEHAPR